MRLGILGKKIGMTQIFDEVGSPIPVTVIATSDCHITQIKSPEKDGYCALQLGFGKRKPQNIPKPLVGHLKKASVPSASGFRELRLPKDADLTQFKLGQALSAGMFQKGDTVDITGTSRGTGFTGVMKRFGFRGKHATHGTSKYFRHGGSSGSNTFPGRVIKNKGMPGHNGNAKRTAQNVRVFQVRPEESLILVHGAVPGPRNGTVLLQSAVKLGSPEGRSWVKAS